MKIIPLPRTKFKSNAPVRINKDIIIPVNDYMLKDFFDIYKYEILEGGNGSGKTYYAIQKALYLICTRKKFLIVIYRQTNTGNDLGVNKVISDMVENYQLEKYLKINKSPSFCVKNKLNGSSIYTKGLKDAYNSKGSQNPSLIIFEEIGDTNPENFYLVQKTQRDELGAKKAGIMMLFNPSYKAFWVWGQNGFIENLFNSFNKNEIRHTITTYRDNHFINKEDFRRRLELEPSLNKRNMSLNAQRDYGISDDNFAYCFEDKRHVSEKSVYTLHAPIYVSIDNNIHNPAAVFFQYDSLFKRIKFIGEYQYNGKMVLIDFLKIVKKYISSTFGDSEIKLTGDRTGISTNLLAQTVDTNIFNIGISVFNLNRKDVLVSPYNQKYLGHNLTIEESYDIINYTLKNYDNFLIHPNCKLLLRDIKTASVLQDKNGKLSFNNKGSGSSINNFNLFDAWRYAIDTCLYEWYKDVKISMRGG